MRSRLWLNLALLALVVGLALLALYEPGKETAPAPTPLTSLNAEAIERVVLRRRNPDKPVEEVQLEKIDGHWFMRKPYAMPANDFRVRSLLRLAETDSLGQHDLGRLDASTYGLDQPRATVIFNDDTVIHFGGTEPLSHRRYVQLGDTLHLIEDLYYYQAAGNLSLFLGHGLLPADARIIDLQLPDLRLSLVEGRWQRTPPREDVSADASAELVTAWQMAQALEVRTGQPRPKDDSLPRIRIRLQDQAEPIEFLLQRSETETTLIRQDNGLQYVLSPEQAKSLLELPEAETDDAANTPGES